MGKRLIVFIVILLTGATVLGGCAEAPPASVTEKPIELKVATWGPPQLPISLANKEWAERIEEQSGSRVKFNFYWDQSLVKAGDTWTAIQTGITDIGYFVIGFGEDQASPALNGFTGLPFMGWEDMRMATDIYHDVFPRFPELEAEFEGTRLLWICSMPPNLIHSVNNEVRIPEDIKGLRVITSSRLAQLAANAGSAPITSIGPPDWKSSLEKGLADSIMVHWSAIYGYNIIPLFNYHTDFGDAGISMGMHGMWANEAAWNKLPVDIQDIILENSAWLEEKIISIDEAEMVKAINEAKKLGHTFSVLSLNEIEAWKKIAKSITDEWIKEVEDMGLPARAVYDEVKKLIGEYRNR
jgi:TRAP-type C4-dicarboxylate transport system substrate-binding protein